MKEKCKADTVAKKMFKQKFPAIKYHFKIPLKTTKRKNI